MSTTGNVLIQYEVLPLGASEITSIGTVRVYSTLPSAGRIASSGNLSVKYEVFRPAQTTVSLAPVADAFILDAKPTLNYGDTVDLIVGRFGSGLARSLLLFDPSVLSAGLNITEVILRIPARVAGTGQVEAHNLFSLWEELGVTWANQPGKNPLPEDEKPMGAAVDLDITTLFLGWYNQKTANNGVMILTKDESVQEHAVFTSREWPQGNMRPELLVTYYTPDALPGSSELASTGYVIGLAQADLPSAGGIPGVVVPNDLPSSGGVTRASIFCIGTARQVSNLPSSGNVRGTRVANDFAGLGSASRPDLPSQGRPRLFINNDFSSTGYVLERSNLNSTGRPRIASYHDLLSEGQIDVFDSNGNYIGSAAGEIPSKGVVTGYYNDLTSNGGVRVAGAHSLPASGYVSGAANELPSQGHANSPWFQSMGTVSRPFDLRSIGKVRIVMDLPSAGTVPAIGAADLAAGGQPQVREISEIPSSGFVRGGQLDLPSKGHIGTWMLQVITTVKAWPPEGRASKSQA